MNDLHEQTTDEDANRFLALRLKALDDQLDAGEQDELDALCQTFDAAEAAQLANGSAYVGQEKRALIAGLREVSAKNEKLAGVLAEYEQIIDVCFGNWNSRNIRSDSHTETSGLSGAYQEHLQASIASYRKGDLITKTLDELLEYER